jgi:hypothetical protein
MPFSNREQLEITLAIVASGLLIVSEGLALSKRSDCNSIAEFLASAGQFIRKQIRREGTPPQDATSTLRHTL